MRNTLTIFAAALLACSITGCYKGSETVDTDYEVIENALVIKPADGSQPLIYPLECVYQFGSAYANPENGQTGAALSYSFYSDSYTKYPVGVNPVIRVNGVRFSDIDYTEPGQWISTILIWGIDQSWLNALHYIPLEYGKFKGRNTMISDVRIDSFRHGEMVIVITTKAGDVVTLNYNDEVLHDDNFF